MNDQNDGWRESSPDDGERRPFGVPTSVVVVATVLTVLGALWAWRTKTADPGRAVPAALEADRYRDSIAVMPLDNLTGDPAFDHMAMAITEGVIANLARIPDLKVTSRHSVEAMASSDLTTPQIARSLGVRRVVEGSIRIDGREVLATLKLIDGETDAHVWSRDFRGDLDSPVEAQNRIARDALVQILESLPELEAPAEMAEHSFGEGLQAYQLGKHWLGRRTPEGLRRAVEAFHVAIELDSTHAAAYADLSSAYALTLTYRYDIGVDGYTIARRSLDMGHRAVELDPALAAGYAARGYIRALVNAPLEPILSDFERAAELQPNAASVPSWSARAFQLKGDTRQAMSEAIRAVNLDPMAAGRHIAVAYVSLQVGEYERSIRTARRATALEPDLMLSRAIQGRALMLSGRPEACLELDLGPHDVLRATCRWEAGEQEEAEAVADSVATALAAGIHRDSLFTPVVDQEDLAVFYAWTGDADRALTWIRRAYAESPTGVEIRVYTSALFDRVRDEIDTEVQKLREAVYGRVVADR